MAELIQITLQRAHNIFTNVADNVVVKTALAEYGYDDARIAEGQTLFTKATAAAANKNQEYGNQYQATEGFHLALTEARKTYMKLVKIARVALEDTPADKRKLGLNGDRGQSFAKLSDQMSLFYSNALADVAIATKMARYGLTAAKLTSGQATFTTVRDAYANQRREMGEAVNATQSRNLALHDLERWVARFLKVARVALEDQSQGIDVLGI